MAEHRIWLLVILFFTKVLFLEAAKILTIGAMGECLLGMQSLVGPRYLGAEDMSNKNGM